MQRLVRSGLGPQPATVVSRHGFRALTEMATFPEVSGQESGLCRGILGNFGPTALNREASLCSTIFQYPKFGWEAVQRPVAFPQRPVRKLSRMCSGKSELPQFQPPTGLRHRRSRAELSLWSAEVTEDGTEQVLRRLTPSE